MRVALVCDYSLDYLGGAQAAFLDQAQILAAAGHRVTIVVPRSSGADLAGIAADCDVVEIAAPLTIPGVDLPLIRNTPALRERLVAELRQRRIDVVHLHSEFGLTAAATLAARAVGAPTVQTVHTFFWRAGLAGMIDRVAARGVRGFARWLRHLPASRQRLAPAATDSALRGITLSTAEQVQAVISPSAHQAEALRAAGANTVHVIPNAAPGGTVDARPLDAVSPPLRVAWIGRLAPEKRVVEFLDAIAIAASRLGVGQLRVEIGGAGPLEAQVRSTAEALRERSGDAQLVDVLGRLPREAVRDRMRAAHLVALTSHGFDNQPVTVVEALTEARPVLYVDSALREGLERGGFLAASQDAAGMADVLVELAAHPERVIARSREALDAARIFTPESHVERLLHVYTEAGAAD